MVQGQSSAHAKFGSTSKHILILDNISTSTRGGGGGGGDAVRDCQSTMNPNTMANDAFLTFAWGACAVLLGNCVAWTAPVRSAG